MIWSLIGMAVLFFLQEAVVTNAIFVQFLA